MLVLCAMMVLGFQPEQVKHFLQPWDIQDAEKGGIFSGVSYLDVDGSHLVLADVNKPEVLIFNTKGDFLHKIKRPGQGPKEFGSNINGLGLDGDALFVVGSKPRAHLFDLSGNHLESFKLKAFNIAYWIAPSFLALDAESGTMVAPAFARTGSLAIAYHFDGRLKKKVGQPLTLSEQEFQRNRSASDQLWVRSGKHWYCAFKSMPLVQKYDQSFRLIAEFEFTGPEVREAKEQATKFIEEGSTPEPIISCFQVRHHRIYAMISTGLLEVDAQTGEHLRTHSFFGRGEGFENTSGNRLLLPIFYFLDDETVVLGHPALLWNHDLWLVNLDGSKPLSSKAKSIST